MRKTIAIAATVLFAVDSSASAQLTRDQIQYNPSPPATPGLNLFHHPEGRFDIWVTSGDPGDSLTTLEIQSKNGSFKGTKADFSPTFDGLFDVYTADKAFKLEPDGFGADLVTFGNLGGVNNRWTFEDFLADVVISGSLKKGGDLSAVTGGFFLPSFRNQRDYP